MTMKLRQLSSDDLEELVKLITGCTCSAESEDGIEKQSLTLVNIDEYRNIVLKNMDTSVEYVEKLNATIEDDNADSLRDLSEKLAEQKSLEKLKPIDESKRTIGFLKDINEALKKYLEKIKEGGTPSPTGTGVTAPGDFVAGASPMSRTGIAAGAAVAGAAGYAAISQVIPETKLVSTEELNQLKSETGFTPGSVQTGSTRVIGDEIRQNGSRSWRNNNPGNLEYGDIAKQFGAIGSDGRFAIFPTYEAGRKAKEHLLFSQKTKYRGLSLDQAINQYAPPSENPTEKYISFVESQVGIDRSTKLDSLSPEQQQKVLNSMEKIEGFKAGTVITTLERKTAEGKDAIVDLGKKLQGLGLRISEHPAFGGVTAAHSSRGGHYDGTAIDVNVGRGVNEATDPRYKKSFYEMADNLRKEGYVVIFGEGDHKDHMHIRAGNKNSLKESKQLNKLETNKKSSTTIIQPMIVNTSAPAQAPARTVSPMMNQAGQKPKEKPGANKGPGFPSYYS